MLFNPVTQKAITTGSAGIPNYLKNMPIVNSYLQAASTPKQSGECLGGNLNGAATQLHILQLQQRHARPNDAALVPQQSWPLAFSRRSSMTLAAVLLLPPRMDP